MAPIAASRLNASNSMKAGRTTSYSIESISTDTA
jgi:hypothetical protein